VYSALPAMSVEFESFQPEKRTLGQILSSTSPPIRVPDYQRDFSWDLEQISDFWSDLVSFGGNDPQAKLTGKEYFLGAAVLVNNGSYHLLLDGQQRLATATILLGALRDKMREYKGDAANQIQDQYIAFEDHLTGKRVFKIELNVFDRNFFRDLIQLGRSDSKIQKKSHHLISKAYKYFSDQIAEGWDKAGGGKNGFEWAAHVAVALLEHVALVTVVSTNEKSAASIFATLNDRGIGLSTVDLIRSWALQHTHDSKRDEVIQYWDETFNACGPAAAAETLVRFSWVSMNGDVKTRALYKIVSESISGEIALAYSRRLRDDAVLYRQFREGETDDVELQDYWLALRTLKFSAAYPLLISAHHTLAPESQKNLTKALVALVIRHNIVCNLDRAKLESLVYATAKKVSDGCGYETALADLQMMSPDEDLFRNNFEKLTFTRADTSIARYLLRVLDSALGKTSEVSVAGPEHVHVEHIYPQSPTSGHNWQEHDRYVNRLGNLTLLDRRLNEQIKNALFAAKKEQAYKDSRLEITKALLSYVDWDPESIEKRQLSLRESAETIWPVHLI
jgi:hypothetical protein